MRGDTLRRGFGWVGLFIVEVASLESVRAFLERGLGRQNESLDERALRDTYYERSEKTWNDAFGHVESSDRQRRIIPGRRRTRIEGPQAVSLRQSAPSC